MRMVIREVTTIRAVDPVRGYRFPYSTDLSGFS
jgi:hypothetical protein